MANIHGQIFYFYARKIAHCQRANYSCLHRLWHVIAQHQFIFSIMCRRVFNKTILLLGLAGYEMIITNSALRSSLVIYHSYYMEESVLLGTKPLVDSIRHFIRDPSGVFSVCHFCECRIVQWRHDSRLLLLLNWFLPSRFLFRIKAWRAGLRPSTTTKWKSLQKNCVELQEKKPKITVSDDSSQTQ